MEAAVFVFKQLKMNISCGNKTCILNYCTVCYFHYAVSGQFSLYCSSVTQGSILRVSMHPPPPGHNPGDLQFFFLLGGLFPTPGHTERDNFPPRGSSPKNFSYKLANSVRVMKQQNSRNLNFVVLR